MAPIQFGRLILRLYASESDLNKSTFFYATNSQRTVMLLPLHNVDITTELRFRFVLKISLRETPYLFTQNRRKLLYAHAACLYQIDRLESTTTLVSRAICRSRPNRRASPTERLRLLTEYKQCRLTAVVSFRSRLTVITIRRVS